MVKPLINCVYNKKNYILSEISFLEEEIDKVIDVSFQQLNQKLCMRFDKLSRERQLELLNYIKGDLSTSTNDMQIEICNYDEMLKLMEELDNNEDKDLLECVRTGYSRRRIISDEIDN